MQLVDGAYFHSKRYSFLSSDFDKEEDFKQYNDNLSINRNSIFAVLHQYLQAPFRYEGIVLSSIKS